MTLPNSHILPLTDPPLYCTKLKPFPTRPATHLLSGLSVLIIIFVPLVPPPVVPGRLHPLLCRDSSRPRLLSSTWRDVWGRPVGTETRRRPHDRVGRSGPKYKSTSWTPCLTYSVSFVFVVRGPESPGCYLQIKSKFNIGSHLTDSSPLPDRKFPEVGEMGFEVT